MIEILLADRTTNRNILWANAEFGDKEILPDQVHLIKPRHEKIRAQQKQRTRDRAEIFTPPEVCKLQNDLVANEKILPTPWTDYIDAKFLEITCGEAPYIVSRYNAATGEPIPIKNRVGLLDRKLRLINRETFAVDDWQKFSVRAVKSVYGYEFQGDNLFLARKNILLTVEDFYREKFSSKLPEDFLREVAEIISWNFWQMDGLTNAVPYADKNPNMNLFDANSHRPPEKIFCKIMDWQADKPIEFRELLKGGRRR